MSSLALYIFTFCISCILNQFFKRKMLIDDGKCLKDKKIRYNEYFFVFITILFPLILSGLREDVGTDYNTYWSYFEMIAYSKVFPQKMLEVGFTIINFFVSFFNGNFTTLLFVTAFLYLFFFTLGLNRITEESRSILSLWLSYMFLFGVSLNAIRQAIAIALCVYAVYFLLKRQYLKYILLVLLAMSFHSTAVICFAFLLFDTNLLESNKMVLAFVVALVGIIFISQSKYTYIILDYMPFLRRFLIFESTTSNYNLYKNLLFNIPYLIPIFFYKKLCYKKNSNKFFLNLLIVQVFLMIYSVQFQYGFRLIYYTYIGIFIIVPQFISLFKHKEIRVLLNFLYISYSLFQFVYNFYLFNANNIFPYQTIFN